MKKIFFTAAFFACVCSLQPVFAQTAGTIDGSFGNNGYAFSNLPSFSQFGSVVVQPDQKIVVMERGGGGGAFTYDLVRFLSDGTIDSTFGTNGQTITNSGSSNDPKQMILLQNGKFLICGTTPYTLDAATIARYNSNGVLDSTFGVNGFVNTKYPGADADYGLAVAEQADGKILLTTQALFGFTTKGTISRFDINGSADPTFGTDGKVLLTSVVGSIRYAPSGKFYVGSSGVGTYTIIRFKSDGVIDSTFGVNGFAVAALGMTGNLLNVEIMSDGKLLGSGTSYSGNFLQSFNTAVRFTTTGKIDSTYGNNGLAFSMQNGFFIHIPQATITQPDGKLVFADEAVPDQNGYARVMLMRFDADGKVDSSFGVNGYSEIDTVHFYPDGIALQQDHKIVVGGHSTAAIVVGAVRFNAGPVSGISPLPAEHATLYIYPSPAGSLVNVSYKGGDKETTLMIYSVWGQMMLKRPLSNTNTVNGEMIDVSLWPAGTYIVDIQNKDVQVTGKFMKE